MKPLIALYLEGLTLFGSTALSVADVYQGTFSSIGILGACVAVAAGVWHLGDRIFASMHEVSDSFDRAS